MTEIMPARARTLRFPSDLADFEGSWRLDRDIADGAGASTARFSGRAVFAWQDGDLAYEETGTLTLAGQVPVAASRGYLWTRRAEGGIAVRFADGRAFHEFDLRDGASATHSCPPDLYHVAYEFGHWPDWTARWRVTGPRKDYTMVSRYGR